MMDDSLDDLFGDEPLAGISALPDLSSIPSSLVQSVDDSRVSGCSQYVRLLICVGVPPEYSSERSLGPIRAALRASPVMVIA